jgi:hypothetical protein
MCQPLILILLFAISAQAQTQIHFSTWIVEMPTAKADAIQKQLAATTDKSAVHDAFLRTSQDDIDLLSAPRVITLPGMSAEIKVVTERYFLSGLEKDEAGDWGPKFEARELGVKVVVNAQPYPTDPTRLTGAFEASLSKLISEREERVPIPGEDPITLSIPVIEEQTLTAGFTAQSGETMLMGRLDREDRVVFVLMRPEVTGIALVDRLQKMVMPVLQMEDASFDDALAYFRAYLEDVDMQILSQATKVGSVTISLRKIPVYEALRLIAKQSGTTMEVDGNTITFSKPE